ncbi:MAG: phosphotransacetylase family protein [Cyanobacteria bacterium P01_D01_bin.73]
MPKRPQHLLIASTEDYSGKSTVLLGLAKLLMSQDIALDYGKPLGSYHTDGDGDADVALVQETLGLATQQLHPTLVFLDQATVLDRLQGAEGQDYREALASTYGGESKADVMLLEGPGTLAEGMLFGLSTVQIAETLEAKVLLVDRYDPLLSVERVLAAKGLLGDRLAGVVMNGVPDDCRQTAQETVKPFLEAGGAKVLGCIPRDSLLRSVSVAELVRQLQATVLCSEHHLDLMVQDLKIGAMNVNSALRFFSQGKNMAVVTGGDRTDIQLAALETSTNCLILTGQVPPNAMVISRAQDLEVPILSVDMDTLKTVEIIDQTFGQVRLQDAAKIECIQQLMEQHFDLKYLLSDLGLELATADAR